MIEKLRMSLAKSWEMIQNPNLDVKTREGCIQNHTNTALALNQILKDRQNRDWEERLRELEEAGKIPRGILPPSKTAARKRPRPSEPAKTNEPRPGPQESENRSQS